MEHLSNDQEDHPNQHENNYTSYDEMGHPILSLLESQWKLRQPVSLLKLVEIEQKMFPIIKY